MNICTDRIKTIHFTGICGTAMGNVAVGLKKAGYIVTGSDSGVYPPMSDFLLENGIEILDFSPENVKNTDLVVIGNAIPRGNCEVEYVLNTKIPFASLPQVINSFFVRNKKLIMVTGTHGKTTTTSLIAFVLEKNGLNPSFLIGGVIPQLNTGFKHSENSKYFVLEGDEYDTAFFDKTSKFLKFIPDQLVINYVEFDHGDIFSSMREIKDTFKKLLKICPSNSHIYLNRDHKTTYSLKKHCYSRVKTFGFSDKSNCKIKFNGYKNGKSIIEIQIEDKTSFVIHSKIPGEHNARNIGAAFMVCYEIGIEPEKIVKTLEEFNGVKNRFEEYYFNEKNDSRIILDFAHHPTAMAYTIKTTKEIFSQKKVIAIIEPATNTMRSGKFNKELYNLSNLTDKIVFLPVPSKKRHSVKDNFCPPQGESFIIVNNIKEFKNVIKMMENKGIVFLFMSNGSPFDYIEICKKHLKGKLND